MTVTAPPRPPRSSDPVDREELEARVEALIEEARQRARRRRRIGYAAIVALVALVGVALYRGLPTRTGRSHETASPAPAASVRRRRRDAESSKIALPWTLRVNGANGRVVRTTLYVMNAGRKREAGRLAEAP